MKPNPNGVAAFVDAMNAREPGHNPVGVGNSVMTVSQGSSCSQPWALGRNPVGILQDADGRWKWYSIPHIAFIPFLLVFVQQLAEFILKTHFAMMLLLVRDVLLHLFEV